MITFTKEQLIASAHARIEFAEMMLAGELEPIKERTWSIELELARIALASLEAEAIKSSGFIESKTAGTDKFIFKAHYGQNLSVGDRLYAAPPAPVVPDALANDIDSDDHPLLWSYNNGWNACRAAMLQGKADGNPPAIPEGYVLVPIEPTEDMVIHGFESKPDPHFSDEEEWKAYDAMSGCQQAAHRAKLCWAAMIKSAPKQENI